MYSYTLLVQVHTLLQVYTNYTMLYTHPVPCTAVLVLTCRHVLECTCSIQILHNCCFILLFNNGSSKVFVAFLKSNCFPAFRACISVSLHHSVHSFIHSTALQRSELVSVSHHHSVINHAISLEHGGKPFST